jgi:hypothetical protein
LAAVRELTQASGADGAVAVLADGVSIRLSRRAAFAAALRRAVSAAQP